LFSNGILRVDSHTEDMSSNPGHKPHRNLAYTEFPGSSFNSGTKVARSNPEGHCYSIRWKHWEWAYIQTDRWITSIT